MNRQEQNRGKIGFKEALLFDLKLVAGVIPGYLILLFLQNKIADLIVNNFGTTRFLAEQEAALGITAGAALTVWGLLRK